MASTPTTPVSLASGRSIAARTCSNIDAITVTVGGICTAALALPDSCCQHYPAFSAVGACMLWEFICFFFFFTILFDILSWLFSSDFLSCLGFYLRFLASMYSVSFFACQTYGFSVPFVSSRNVCVGVSEEVVQPMRMTKTPAGAG